MKQDRTKPTNKTLHASLLTPRTFFTLHSFLTFLAIFALLTLPGCPGISPEDEPGGGGLVTVYFENPETGLMPEPSASVEDAAGNTYTAAPGDSGPIPDKGISGLSLPVNLYGITVIPPKNGVLAAVPAAQKGETVTLTATADTGYTMMTGFPKVYKTGAPGTIVAVDGAEPGYSFTMPGYDVTIEADIRSSAKAIEFFSISRPWVWPSGTIDEGAKTVTITVPHGTDVTNMETFIGHTGASITPASGETVDFTNQVTYTVTAEDETTARYTVTVEIAASP